MDAETRKKIHKILDLVIDRNESGKSTFFGYSGHINAVSVRIHEGEWKAGQACETHYAYIDNQELDESLDEVIKALC